MIASLARTMSVMTRAATYLGLAILGWGGLAGFDELALHGYRPFEDKPDPRPLPASDTASMALESVIEALSGLFIDTRLEADLPDLLWSFVNLFHRKADRTRSRR